MIYVFEKEKKIKTGRTNRSHKMCDCTVAHFVRPVLIFFFFIVMNLFSVINLLNLSCLNIYEYNNCLIICKCEIFYVLLVFNLFDFK